jgi:hypothetical protein
MVAASTWPHGRGVGCTLNPGGKATPPAAGRGWFEVNGVADGSERPLLVVRNSPERTGVTPSPLTQAGGSGAVGFERGRMLVL